MIYFPFAGSRTATAKALNLALTEFALRGTNRNAKVVWILTDGKSNTGGSPFPPAAALKGKGTDIYEFYRLMYHNRDKIMQQSRYFTKGCDREVNKKLWLYYTGKGIVTYSGDKVPFSSCSISSFNHR